MAVHSFPMYPTPTRPVALSPCPRAVKVPHIVLTIQRRNGGDLICDMTVDEAREALSGLDDICTEIRRALGQRSLARRLAKRERSRK